MSIQSISMSQVSQAQLAELNMPGDASVVNLEDRMLKAFAETSVDAQTRTSQIDAMLRNPNITDPEQLALLQQRSGEYAVDVSMINALVRKAVGTAEALLRSS